MLNQLQVVFKCLKKYKVKYLVINIERSLFHKVQELKFIISADINHSDKGKTLNRQTSPKKNSLSKAIDFELYKIGSIWIPLIPDMVDINPHTVLSLPLIDYIVESAAFALSTN